MPPSSDPEVMAFLPLDESEEAERLAALARRIPDRSDFTLLDPKQARHMFASISYDPFEEESDVLFRTAELTLEDESGLPSPALPDRRQFIATIFLKDASRDSIEVILNKLLSNDDTGQSSQKIQMYQDGLRVDLYMRFRSISDAPTSELLLLAHELLENLLEELQRLEPNLSTWTKEAWKELTDISLGESWQVSQKVYVSIASEDGVRNLRGVDKPLEQDWGPSGSN